MEPDFKNEDYDKKWSHNLVSRSKFFDKKKNFEKCDLTVEWVEKKMILCNFRSEYTGIKMFPSKTKFFPFKPSLDRIDNSKGHTKDNVKLVCMAENFARNNFTFDEFQEYLLETFNIRQEVFAV